MGRWKSNARLSNTYCQVLVCLAVVLFCLLTVGVMFLMMPGPSSLGGTSGDVSRIQLRGLQQTTMLQVKDDTVSVSYNAVLLIENAQPEARHFHRILMQVSDLESGTVLTSATMDDVSVAGRTRRLVFVPMHLHHTQQPSTSSSNSQAVDKVARLCQPPAQPMPVRVSTTLLEGGGEATADNIGGGSAGRQNTTLHDTTALVCQQHP